MMKQVFPHKTVDCHLKKSCTLFKNWEPHQKICFN